MPTNDFYLQILASIDPGLEHDVLRALTQGHMGRDHRISRVALIAKVFGKQIDKKALANSPEDRQIRKVILSLQERGIPVFSDSGKGGYYLGNAADRELYLIELENRKNALEAKIRMLRSAAFEPVYEIQPDPVQLTLLGVRL